MMSREQTPPCRICTLPGLDLDLEAISHIRYRSEWIDARGQKADAAAPVAYCYLGPGCVRVWGDADIRTVRTAWRRWLTRTEEVRG